MQTLTTGCSVSVPSRQGEGLVILPPTVVFLCYARKRSATGMRSLEAAYDWGCAQVSQADLEASLGLWDLS